MGLERLTFAKGSDHRPLTIGPAPGTLPTSFLTWIPNAFSEVGSGPFSQSLIRTGSPVARELVVNFENRTPSTLP